MIQAKTFVKYIKYTDSETKSSYIRSSNKTKAFKELHNIHEFLTDTHNITATDKIVYIICYGNELHEIHSDFEKSYRNIQVFHVSNLLYNISKHKLVPKHTIVESDDIVTLKQQLNIKSIHQLPAIKKNDPMAKYLGLNVKDVCKIYRPSKSTIQHICYRVCEA